MPSYRIFFCLLLFNLSAALSATPDVGNLLEAAQSDYQHGHLEAALAKLKQRDQQQGKSGEALDLRGAIALEQGNFDAARKAFTEAHQVEPALFAPRLHLADLFLREKKYAEADGAYQQLAAETDVLISNERCRYGILLAALARHDESAARAALARIKFPTESPAYYFAQAAWEFAHGQSSSAQKWIVTARGIFTPPLLAWFARPLYELGWQKDRPSPAVL
jgi:tetratricopeptide (TPR) repeat protein